jgi:pilus assembly protein Flp/PilA
MIEWHSPTSPRITVKAGVARMTAQTHLVSKLKGDIMTATLSRFVRDESGATAIEYGLIAAGIAVAIIAAVNAVGTALNTTFTAVKTNLTAS